MENTFVVVSSNGCSCYRQFLVVVVVVVIVVVVLVVWFDHSRVGCRGGFDGFAIGNKVACQDSLDGPTRSHANRDRFHPGASVQAQVLSWGNAKEAQQALNLLSNKHHNNRDSLLIIAADCVYFSELHLPLEQTIVHLLQHHHHHDNNHSLCVLAGARRWKRDNAFYAKLGHKTKTATHRLVCECWDEQVQRNQDGGDRQVLRVYGIEWKDKKNQGNPKEWERARNSPHRNKRD